MECFVPLNCFLEICCFIKVVEALSANKGSKQKILQYVFFGIIIVISAYINIFDGNRNFQGLHYISLLCLIIVRYEMQFFEAIIYTLLGCLIVSVLELMIYILCNIVCRSLEISLDFSVLVVSLTLGICCILKKAKFMLLGKHLIENLKKRSNKYIVLFVISIAFGVIVNMINFDERMTFGEGLYLFLLVCIFLIMIYKISKEQIELEVRREYEKRYDEVISEIRARQHKFTNQLNSIYSLHKLYDNYDELVEHQMIEMERLNQYAMPNKILILERPLVITHIYNKLCEAKEKNIDVTIEFSCSLNDISVPDILFVEIIGNLLDNAIEEVEKSVKREKVLFSISEKQDEICISVSNEHIKIPYEEYRKFFNEGYSTKGESRGIGLPYVKRIVENYSGRIDMGNVELDGSNYFTIRLYLKRK